VKSFERSGICLVADEGIILCVVQPEIAKRLLAPLPVPFLDITEDLLSESDEADLGHEDVFIEECADLLYDSKSRDEVSKNLPEKVVP
jgi:hypothetical protein